MNGPLSEEAEVRCQDLKRKKLVESEEFSHEEVRAGSSMRKLVIFKARSDLIQKHVKGNGSQVSTEGEGIYKYGKGEN